MKNLLVGINAKYIHPALAIYQLSANTTYPVTTKEFTIKDTVEHICEYIINNDFEFVGFSCYLWNITMVKKISQKIKKINPFIKILYGGPEVSFDGETYLLDMITDYIIYSEGEESFHLLLQALENKMPLDTIPNLLYNDKGVIKKTPLKLPDLSKVKLATLKVNDYQKRIVYLESSRGCPFNCSYCVASTTNKLRLFPLDYVLPILKTLMEEQIKTIKFLDRTFNAEPLYLTKILDFIEKHNISTTFQFEIVVDRLTSSLIEKIKSYQKSTLRFEIGIQSTNPIVNESIRRHQDMEKVTNNILLLNDAPNIDLHVDLIAGLPYEDLSSFKHSFNDTFALFPKELQLGFLKFLKGTHLMNLINEHEYQYHLEPPYEIIKSKYLSISDLQEIHYVEATLEKFYNSGHFKRTWNYLKKKELIHDYYQEFLQLYYFLDNLHFSYLDYQLLDLFVVFDSYLKITYPVDYELLHFNLLMDYYTCFKVKPKVWGITSLTKEEKFQLYPQLITHLQGYTLEDLYRYALVFNHNNQYFVIFYKDFKHYDFLIVL